ncbi:MAG: nucleotidyltransferase domain-containing protein [Planctomycetes bacterium]|nr:nucleotidyltransferase domain-containing protein [Planctomycetota bacterium]
MVRELTFFGSVLRDDFGLESDVDVLVVFGDSKDWDLWGGLAMREKLCFCSEGKLTLSSSEGLHNPFGRRSILPSRQAGDLCSRMTGTPPCSSTCSKPQDYCTNSRDPQSRELSASRAFAGTRGTQRRGQKGNCAQSLGAFSGNSARNPVGEDHRAAARRGTRV